MAHSIKNVAEKAGVSIATVSRVLAGKGYISADAREKVEAAVKELGYRPNRVARSLRAQRSKVIGLIISDIRNPFFSEISRAVETVAMKSGYSVLMCNTDEDPKKEARYLELMSEEKVAGILLSPTKTGVKHLQEYRKNSPPIVLFDRKLPDSGLDSVVIDNFDAAFKLATSLIEGGFQRIVGIFGAKSYTATERIRGFRAAFGGDEEKIAGVYQIPAFEEEGEKLIGEILKLQPAADAIMCSSALIATGAYKALAQRGIRIPEQMGFAAFDDPSWASFVNPPVTVIRQPAVAIGQAGAELLLKRIHDESQPITEICLMGELVTRASSRKNEH